MPKIQRNVEKFKGNAKYGDIIETRTGFHWLVEDSNGNDILVDIETGEAMGDIVDSNLFIGGETPEDEEIINIYPSESITITF